MIFLTAASCCLHPSLKSYDFERFGNGFQEHVRHEHNMWAYLSFQLHLSEKDSNDYTSHEQYFKEMIETHRETEVFPINRAMALQTGEDSGVDAKLESIERSLLAIIARLDEQERREFERERQAKELDWKRAVTDR